MKNFVTYTSAEFNCGPSLNMIIGPNGTGKSTLVCAICLGLGWSPNVLGRAKGVGDYVKNGQLEASIEIELKGTADRNIIVKRVIKRAGNKSTWWLNGKERTHKRIKETMAKLKIQVDNLCQFLPQDKVVEFAAMTPVQLLEQTQQAVADPKVSQWHAELKTLGDKQKRLLESKEGRAKALADLTSRQQAQQADVDRMNERQTHEFRKETLMKFRPFFEYKSVKQRSRESKEELYQAKADQKALSNELAPALQTLNNKKDYAERIKAESDNLKSRMTQAKSNISLINSQIIGYKERMKTCDAKIKAETTQQTKKKEELSRCKHALATLERKSKEPPPEFDGVEMNRKIREFEAQIEEMKAQSRELQTVARQKANAFNAKKDEKELIENEIEALQTRSGQLTDKLRKISSDSAKAYAWLQKNKDKFEREVYGPPLVTCSIKKPECADAVESALKRGDFVTFTVTTRKDFLTLQDCLLSNREGCLSLSDITIKQASRPLSAFQRPTDEATLRNLGFDGWLLGALDGPEPVLAMLSENAGLHRTAFTSRPQSEAEFDRVKNSPITRWATKDTLFAVQSRKEYNQTSTTTTALRKARNWVDQPVDTSRQSELKRLVLELEHERETLKEEWNQIKSQNYKLGQEMQDIVTARVGFLTNIPLGITLISRRIT
jgi:chromosome segregation ATPase